MSQVSLFERLQTQEPQPSSATRTGNESFSGDIDQPVVAQPTAPIAGPSYNENHHVSAHFHSVPPQGRAFDGGMNPFDVLHEKNADEASVGTDGADRQILPIADMHGNPVHLPGDEQQQEMASLRNIDVDSEKGAPRSVIVAAFESFKYLYSSAVLITSVFMLMAALFSEQTLATTKKGMSPILSFFIFWLMICWLFMIEGGQGCLVGLQPIEKALYSETHPRTLDNISLCQKGNNMSRFIAGRQFLVVLAVYYLNLMFTTVADVDVLGLHSGLQAVFLTSGASLVLVTIMIGQLVAQVNAANCMLDFINNYFMLYCVTYTSLVVEFSGLLHSVYLVEAVFSKITGKPIGPQHSSRTATQNVFFWGRVLFSSLVMCFAAAVTVKAVFEGNTTTGLSSTVAVVLFFVLTCFIGLMEGVQIALFTVVNLSSDELGQHPRASKNCQLTFTGQNLQAFLVGRQICVTTCMFVLAQITTVDIEVGAETNIFGVSDGLQNFFNTGFLGALLTTVGASLGWRIVGYSFPIAFLSNPLINILIHLCLVVERTGLCSASWVLARYHKLVANYQPDTVYLEGAEPHSSEPVSRRDNDIDRLMTIIRFSASLGLLALSILMITASMFTEQTLSTKETGLPPALVFCVFWVLILLLAVMEGGQGCLVGLQPVHKDFYAASHPMAAKITNLVHAGDSMERFIVGRQFLVVLGIFLVNFMTSSVEGANVLSLPDIVNDIFLGTGAALILTTIILGQLTAQVNAACCLLDFTNSYFMLFVTYISLATEFTGILHSAYFFQRAFAKTSGRPIDSIESPRTAAQSLFFWARVLLSTCALSCALAITFSALLTGRTTTLKDTPPAIAFVVLLALMCFVGIMEGIQIALFAVLNLPEDDLKKSSVVYANCQLAFNGQNLQAFLIGRQICVTTCLFVIARITALDVEVGVGDNIFNVPDGVQEFFNTGLLGALVVTIVASLVWRVIASTFPFEFLSNPLVYFMIRLCLLLETSGLCSAAWVFGRWTKLAFRFQPDNVYFEKAAKHGKEPVTRRDKEVDVAIAVIKYCYSVALLIFCVTVVIASIFSEQTKMSEQVHPVFAFFLVAFLLVWIAMMEGGQGCLVGLQPVEKGLYKGSHPVAFKSTRIAHLGDNMERFLVGRQFLVVLAVFVCNMAGAALPGSSVLGLSDTMNSWVVESGVALILMTIVVGQLAAQINAADCMLDFINTHLMVFTTYASLGIEYSGLLHAVYLVQFVFSKLTGIPIESKEAAPNGAQSLFFWVRVSFSLFVLAYSFAVTLSALFNGNTTMWGGIPPSVSVVCFFVLMAAVGLMDGMQIALFAVVNLPEEELFPYHTAKKTCELVFKGTNLQAFLIGRQILVTICMFVVARISTVDIEIGLDDNIFDVPDILQRFFNTGLLGTVITTIFGSLAWRIMASAFPISFLSNPLVYLLVRACLLLDASGVCSSAWLLALIHKQVAGLQPDEFYIGTYMENKGFVDVELPSSESVSDSTSDPDPPSSVESKELSIGIPESIDHVKSIEIAV
eukprot:CAMPEP_0116997896 /NCGR_PEP_ID=MMETSP0472-20121206/1164_1 /TAXON_ID=693140 ORGANISM="Tiarina fusus, Strain LIS" /NCGR_SAMPLE_ID=MMETSP0472 /ASSEMBLY_ACC=CAM_ASM_000603 /LENGTH=1521 /DNA_ID=CAMNT_0004696899 /DNA_START=147 /DNA_END=4712 /DNA_ORIENTATION=-